MMQKGKKFSIGRGFHRLALNFRSLLPLLFIILSAFLPTSVAGVDPDHPVYQYWAEENYPPFEFTDSSGNAAGFSVDLIRAIGEEEGFTVNVSPHPWADVKAALTNNSIDISGTMAYDRNRTDRFAFSVPVTTLNWYIYVLENSTISSLDQLKGKRIILVKGDIWEEKLKNEKFPADITIAPNYRQQIIQMSEGRYDAALIAKPSALYLMQQEGITNLKPVGEPVDRLKLCIATHVSKPALIGMINEGIVVLNQNGKYESISNKWFAPLERQAETEIFNKIFLYVLLPILGLILFILFWIWTLRKMVARKTDDLRNELAARMAAQEALLSSKEELRQNFNDLQMTQDALQLSETKYRALFEDSILGIFQADMQGNFLEINPAFAQIFGYDTLKDMNADFAGTSGQMFAGTDEQDLISHILQHEDEIRGYESERRRRDGTPVWISINLKIVRDETGRVLFYEGTVEDITRRKRAEDENEISLRQIQKNFAELAILNDGIRNPLTIIATLAESLNLEENQMMMNQVTQIDDLISQLDIRWVESEKIIRYLKRHHDIIIKKTEKKDSKE